MKYFLHDTNSFNDEKVTELFIEHGYKGLGLFYTTLEKIAFQEKPIKTVVLKKQLGIKGKRLTNCWTKILQLELISVSNDECFNTKLLQNSDKYLQKKEKNRKRVADFREKQENVMRTEPLRNAYVTPPNIIKDKISKDNISILQTDVCEEKFNVDEYLKILLNDKKKHISLIGRYFQLRGVNFPSKKAADKELRRWLSDSSMLLEYKDEEIKCAHYYVSNKFPDEWNLGTMLKYISNPIIWK